MRSSFRRSRAAFALACAIVLPGVHPPVAWAQEIPGRRLPDIYIVAQFNDGYWQWYRDYLQRRDEQRQRISEIRMQLGVIAAERQKLRAEWLKLLYLENQLTPSSEYDPGWGPYWESVFGSLSFGARALAGDVKGAASVGEVAGEVRRELDQWVFRWSNGLWGAPLVSDEAAGGQIEESYQGERDLRRARINEWKNTQKQLIDEALRLNRDLAASCATQKQKSGERRPWLNAEALRLADETTVLRLYLYDAAQWYLPDELPALVAALDVDNTATEEVAALLRAKVHLATATWNDEKTWLQLTSPRQAPPDPRWIAEARRPRLEAIAELRRVLQLNPDNAEARGMLIDAELWWLREIAAKLDLESRASLEAFQQYLSNRGFYVDQPEDWTQDLFEVGAALWGLGPIAMAAGLPGLDVAGARATELDTTQTLAARNQVSLLALMRLVKNGVPLHEIPTLTLDQLAGRMTLHTADGRKLPADRARRIVQDIRATLDDLKDLQRLASPDTEHLAEDVNAAFARTYYAPLDPTYTLYESIGDLLNIHNVAFLWGPGSIVKMNGKWSGLKYVSDDAIAVAEKAGTLLTGRQAFLSLTRLDRLAKTVASTSIGSRWANAMAADRTTREALGVVGKIADPKASLWLKALQAAREGVATANVMTDLGFRLSASMILYAGSTYLAEEAGIPGAAILIELLGEVGPAELLSDVMRRSGASPEAIGSRLGEVAEFLGRQQGELAASRKFLDRVSDLADEMRGKAPDGARQAAIRRELGQALEQLEAKTATRVPGSVAEPVDEAARAAAQALQKGDVAEAAPAISGGLAIADGARKNLDGIYARLAAVRAELDAAARAEARAIALPAPAKALRELGAPEKFWRPDLYAGGRPGHSLRLGDEAWRRGDLEAAADHYRTAKKLAGEDVATYRPQLEHAESQLFNAVNAKRTEGDLARLQALMPQSSATRAIGERSAAEALDGLDRELAAGTVKPSGSLNPVYITRDSAGETYYVKYIKADAKNPLLKDLTREQMDAILATEASAASLAQAVGLHAAAARYDPQRHALISRGIPSDGAVAGTLYSKPEYVALALREDYARQRIFRTWIGDADGHPGNLIVGNDGRLYLIDFDMAVLSGTSSRQFAGFGPQSEGDLLKLIVDTTARQPRILDMANFRWIARLDQTFGYSGAARRQVEAIKALVARPGELRRILTDAGYPDVEGAVKSLTERAELLEKVLQPLFDNTLLQIAAALRGTVETGRVAGLLDEGRPHVFERVDLPAREARSWRESLPRAA